MGDPRPSGPATGARRRIFLVDDHALVREGLAKLIEQESDFTVCGEAEDLSRAYSQIEQLHPDAVIVDISLGADSGLDLIKRLQDWPNPPPTLVLSMHDEAVYATRAIRAGARGYVMKRETSGKIIAGLRQILLGGLYLSENAVARGAQECLGTRRKQETSIVERLTDRELQIFRMIGLGEENRQIAELLNLSLKTVQAHCAHMKEKLDLPNGTLLMMEAVRWVEQEGNAAH